MAMAVVTVASGGLPITDVTATKPALGMAVTEALRGQPVTKVPNGRPATYVADSNYWPPDSGGSSGIVMPPLDGAGWAVFTASPDTRTVYVSITGSNANDGLTAATPKKNISNGLALLRNGFPDWLLLKKGDTWPSEGIYYLNGLSGRSAGEPMLISSYGTGARPLLKTIDDAIGCLGAGSNHLAVVGLEFYAFTRNPADPGFVGAGAEQNNIRFVGPCDNLLIEDCKFSFYTGGSIESASSNVRLRRSIFVDNWDLTTGTHSQGLFFANVLSLLVEDCLFDHNGWNPTVPGAAGTVFNHNIYHNATNGPITARNNIFAFASATGMQARSGGTITGNLFVRNAIGLQISSTDPHPVPVGATVTGNLIMESCDIPIAGDPRGWGLTSFINQLSVTFQNNIIAHVASASGTNTVAISIDTGADNDIYTNNIIYDWGGTIILDNGSGNTTAPNAINGTGYLDPTRNVASYMASIGGTATLTAFLAAARAQSKEAGWNAAYTAAPVISHVAAGFGAAAAGITQVGSAVTIGINHGANNGTVTTTLTVPAGTQLALVAVTGYSSTSAFFSGGVVTMTKSAVNTPMTVVPGGGDLADHVSTSMWYIAAPDTGTNKTITWDWAGTGGASTVDGLWSVTFWSGVNATTPVRSGDGAQSSGSAVAVSTSTLTAASGDKIVAFAGGYNAAGDESATFDTWSNLTKLTDVTHYVNFDGAWATGSPSGNTAVGLSTGTNIGYTAIKAVVLKP